MKISKITLLSTFFYATAAKKDIADTATKNEITSSSIAHRKLPKQGGSMGSNMGSGMGGGIRCYGKRGGMNVGGMGGCGKGRGVRARRLDRYSRRALGYMTLPEAPDLPSSYSYNPSLSNDNWEKFTADDFSEALQCEKIPLLDRPIHDASTWDYLRQTYEDVVGSGRSSIYKAFHDIQLMDKMSRGFSSADDNTALYVDILPGKGRGIKTSKDIKSGDRVWSDIYIAAFYDVHDFNRFLAVLPTQLACDVITWKYDIDEDPDDFFFSVNLDISSFCNDGSSSKSNIFWESGPIANTFLAARDISAGEELLCDYGNDNTYAEV